MHHDPGSRALPGPVRLGVGCPGQCGPGCTLPSLAAAQPAGTRGDYPPPACHCRSERLLVLELTESCTDRSPGPTGGHRDRPGTVAGRAVTTPLPDLIRPGARALPTIPSQWTTRNTRRPGPAAAHHAIMFLASACQCGSWWRARLALVLNNYPTKTNEFKDI